MWYREQDRKLHPTDALRALVYGCDAMIPDVNRVYTKRKIAQARNLLLQVQDLLSEGIADGTEARK
jgi:hypothetical protein